MIGSRALRAAALGLSVMAAVVLTGCSSYHPGAAIRVGDTVVTRETVETMTTGYCTVLEKSGRLSSTVPRSAVSWLMVNQVLAATVENAYGDRVGASYDGAALRKQVTSIEALFRALPAQQRRVLVEQFTGIVKGDLIAVSIGEARLRATGVTQPSENQARSAGYRVARAWAKKQGIQVDPRYNVGRTGTAGGGDGSISVPVSTFAKGAVSGSTRQGFTGGLPARQRCG